MNDDNAHDLWLERLRFLYAPADVAVRTRLKTSKGGGERAAVHNYSFEFGEGALYYRASGARISGNYFAFNAFEARGSYTVGINVAKRTEFDHSTLYYNGAKGGHFNWGSGNWMYHNLVVGQLFLGPSFGASVHHTTIGGQEGLVVEYNWCFCRAKAQPNAERRFDTSLSKSLRGTSCDVASSAPSTGK